MENLLSWNDLHDATLIRIACDWRDGRIEVHLRAPSCPEVLLVATGVKRFDLSREQPWGPSVSVSDVHPPVTLADGGSRLEVAMQSGDAIVIDAEHFQLRCVE